MGARDGTRGTGDGGSRAGAAAVSLLELKSLDAVALGPVRAHLEALSRAPGQEAFIGDPASMVALGLSVADRHPFAVLAGSVVVGLGTLHIGAATDAGWTSADGAVLLRGFLIGREHQGHGYGTAAATAAVGLGLALKLRHHLPATGVVLGVNELNAPGQRAYQKAGYRDCGRFLGDHGPQRVMFRPFPGTVVNQG